MCGRLLSRCRLLKKKSLYELEKAAPVSSNSFVVPTAPTKENSNIIVEQKTIYVSNNAPLLGELQTITLTGDVTGTGTGSFATTIAPGSVDIPMLSATGTPDGTKVLYGDNTWRTVGGGGGAVDSVNGFTGVVVLDTDDIDEGASNFYYTDAASRNAISLTSDSSSLTYNNTTGVFTYTDPTGSPGAASHIEIAVRNTTGSTIPANSAVYISGVQGNNDLIELAVNTGTNPAMGVTTSSINHNSDGIMIISGEVRSFNTSSYSENDTLYLSSTAGQLTNVRPSAETQFVQNIGRVVRVGNNGTIVVQGAGRANDIPNLNPLHVFIGDTGAPERRQLTYTDILNTPTDTDDLSEGTTNLYYTEARVSANTDVVANTAKVGITTQQSNDITANNAKVSNATHTGDVTGDTVLTIAAGAVDIAMLSATGTPSATTYLRGDNTWGTPAGGSTEVILEFACSDFVSVLAALTSVSYKRMPFAGTVNWVRASLLTAATGTTLFQVDINKNGTSILSTEITINAGATTSVGATTPAVIGTSGFADDDVFTIDIVAVGNTTSGRGLIVTMGVTPT